MVGGKKGGELIEVLVKENEKLILKLKIKLTLRISLSLHAKAYDPIGLVLPTKMVGAILFRKTLQFVNAKFPLSEAKSKIHKGKIRWDFEIQDFGEDNDFLSSWIIYFGMLVCFKSIIFPRSLSQ